MELVEENYTHCLAITLHILLLKTEKDLIFLHIAAEQGSLIDYIIDL